MIDGFLIDKQLFSEFQWANNGSATDKLVNQLIEFGLDPYQVDLVILRVVEKKSMKEIVKELGWRSTDSANYHLKKALKMLRERNFNCGTN